MKRIWAAIVLLVLVISGCLYNGYAVPRTIARISAPLTQAMHCGDPAQAQAYLAAAQAQYTKRESYLCAVMNRQLLDSVRVGFARSQTAAQRGNTAEMQISLAELQQAVAALR